MRWITGAVVAASMAAAIASASLETLLGQSGWGFRQDRAPPPADWYAPRFDGLRFIETLVTAHR